MAQITVRLTAENVEKELKPGDRFVDDPDFGTVTNVWLVHGGTAAKVFTDRGKPDILGLPQTVKLER